MCGGGVIWGGGVGRPSWIASPIGEDELAVPALASYLDLLDAENSVCKKFDSSGLAKEMGRNCSKRNSFSIFSQNMRSISQNFDKLHDVVQEVNQGSGNSFLFSIIAVQETWKVNEIFNIPGYQKFIS